MILTLRRDPFQSEGTTGELLQDGQHVCWTLENTAKIIPVGTYRVTLYKSEKFGRIMPLLEDVPGRTAIEIHWGSYPMDFEGCIGVGEEKSNGISGPAIWYTRNCFDRVFQMIEQAQPDCSIQIVDPA